MTKFEAILILPLLFAALLATGRTKGLLVYLLVLLIATAHFLLHCVFYDLPYASAILNELIASVRAQPRLLACALTLYAFIIIILIRMRMRGDDISRINPKVRFAIGFAAFACVLWLYFIRPEVGESPERANLLEFSMLYGTGLFWWAAASFVWFWMKGLKDEEGLLWIAAAGITLFFSISLSGEHHLYPWSARRFLPVTVPALAVFSGCFAAEILLRASRAAKVVLVAGLSLLISAPLLQYPFLVTGRDYPGALSFLDKLNRATGGFDILICEQVKLAVPLDFICGRNVLLFNGSRQTIKKCGRLESLTDIWLGEGKEVAYITSGPPIHGRGISFKPVEEITYSTTVVPLKRHAMPTGITDISTTVRILKAQGLADETLPDTITLDIDYNCFNLLEGFHPPKRTGRSGHAGRWTGERASLIIPWFGDGSGAELCLRLSTGQRSEASVPLTIRLGGERLCTINARGRMREYRMNVPEGIGYGMRRIRLDFHAPTWNPAEEGIGGYPEDLGVFLESLTIRKRP